MAQQSGQFLISWGREYRHINVKLPVTQISVCVYMRYLQTVYMMPLYLFGVWQSRLQVIRLPRVHSIIKSSYDLNIIARLYNNYSISPSWIWSDKITNERVAWVGYDHFISNKGEWNNCFSKFSNRVLPPIFICKILQSDRKENLAHYFPYDVKLRLLAHSRSF